MESKENTDLPADYRAHLLDLARSLRTAPPPQGLDGEYDAGPSKADIDNLADKYVHYADSGLWVD